MCSLKADKSSVPYFDHNKFTKQTDSFEQAFVICGMEGGGGWVERDSQG